MVIFDVAITTCTVRKIGAWMCDLFVTKYNSLEHFEQPKKE